MQRCKLTLMTQSSTDRGTPALAQSTGEVTSPCGANSATRLVGGPTSNEALGSTPTSHEKAAEIVLRWTAEIMERDRAELKPEQDFTADLGATSVERLDIIVAVERELGVEFSGSSLGDIRRVQDLTELTSRHLRP